MTTQTEATQYIKATLTAFGPDEAISMTQETWAKLHEAMKALAEQPAQQEPVAKMGMYEHKCPNVTGHRGPSFVCQKAGHGVGQNSYCKGCICPEALNISQPAPATELREQEPVDFASLLREAEEIVREKPTWKRFIDGTPLANDIAVWMTVFAQDVARRASPPAQRKPLTDEQIREFYGDNNNFEITGPYVIAFARAIEAKLRERNT